MGIDGYMYKIRYHSGLTNHWFQDWHCWSRRRAMREYGNAMLAMAHLDIIEIWKFNWRKWEWERLDWFERKEG